MQNTILLFLFGIFLIQCYGKTDFVHLVGYELFADTLKTYPAYNNGDCLKACTETVACLAVQMNPGIGDCKLLTMVRSVVPDEWLCRYFIKNLTTVNIDGRILTPAEQLIQNAVYAAQGNCPDGWTGNSTTCILSVSEAVCNQYASFLEATWDGTICIIPLMNIIYDCPSSQLTLQNFTNGYYCYAVIPKGSLNSSAVTAQLADDYCYQQTGGHIASIHSEEENDFIKGLRNMSILHGIGFGLVFDFTVLDYTDYEDNYGVKNVSSSSWGAVKNASSYTWFDGTSLDYADFLNTTQDVYAIFPFAIMSNQWVTYSNIDSFSFGFKLLACKSHANTVFVKV